MHGALGIGISQAVNYEARAEVDWSNSRRVAADIVAGLLREVSRRDVYFNVNDVLNEASAETKSFYELIRTSGTATTQDDLRFNPTSVSYNAATGLARLIFDAADITTATEAVTNDMQAISADLYAQAKQAQPDAGAAGSPPPPPPPNADGAADGDVMDADFEMVDDDKKDSK